MANTNNYSVSQCVGFPSTLPLILSQFQIHSTALPSKTPCIHVFIIVALCPGQGKSVPLSI